jgi:hypothetical protein
MFMGGMAEVKKSTIPLEDVSYNSFLILLEVIYRYDTPPISNAHGRLFH